MGLRELVGIPKLGLGLKRLMIAWSGMVLIYIWYVVGSYLTQWMEGVHFLTAWKLFGLFPILELIRTEGVTRIVAVAVVVFSLIPLYFTALGVVRMTYRQLAGDEFYEVQRAFRFSFSRLRILFQTLDLLALAWILILIPMGLFLIAVRIPLVGPVIFLLTLPINLFLGLLFLYLVVGFVVALFTTPPAVAIAQADAFDGIFEALTTLNQQGGRFLIHQVWILLWTSVGTFLFAALLWGNWEMVKILAQWLGGEGVRQVLEAREAFLGMRIAWLGKWESFLGLVAAGVQIAYLLLIPAYMWSTFWVGQTLSFLHIAQVKDDLDYLKMGREEDHA